MLALCGGECKRPPARVNQSAVAYVVSGEEVGTAGTARGDALMQALHDEHAQAVLALAMALTGGDRARAQDVVQETLLRAWRHPEVLDQSAGSARGWLLTVARNVVVDEWRAARSRPPLTGDEPPEVPVPDATDQVLQRWVVADALRRLSPEHRGVIVECFYRGRSVAEAAALLGVPQGTVKSRTHYALRALRLALEEGP